MSNYTLPVPSFYIVRYTMSRGFRYVAVPVIGGYDKLREDAIKRGAFVGVFNSTNFFRSDSLEGLVNPIEYNELLQSCLNIRKRYFSDTFQR